jgi:hypothetical protein
MNFKHPCYNGCDVVGIACVADLLLLFKSKSIAPCRV